MLHSSDSYCSKVNCNSYFERHYTIIWASQVARLVKNLPAIAGDSRDVGSIPGSERSPGKGNGNPLQYSCLENTMDRGVLWASRLQRIGHDWVHTCMHVIISISLWKLKKMCVFVYICMYLHMCMNIKFNFAYLSIKTSLYSDCTKTFANFICITKKKKKKRKEIKITLRK